MTWTIEEAVARGAALDAELAATKAILVKVGARARELRLTCRGLGQQLGRHKRLLEDMTRANGRRKHGAKITARIERELRAALEAAAKELQVYGHDNAAREAQAALRNRSLFPAPADTLEEKLGQHLAGLLEEHEGSSPEIRERLARRLHALFNGPMESPETERVFIEAAERIEAICAQNRVELEREIAACPVKVENDPDFEVKGAPPVHYAIIGARGGLQVGCCGDERGAALIADGLGATLRVIDRAACSICSDPFFGRERAGGGA